MKFLGFLFLAIVLVATGFFMCYFGLGDKLRDVLISAKDAVH